MSATRDELIEQAIALVRVQGYAGFSYADLADTVGIRKPSIHHYFPSKEDLAEAIVEAYSEQFFGRLEAIAAKPGTLRERISAYAEIYREALKADQACLCGMLASEVAILPERVRRRVAQFFERNLQWLEAVLSASAGKAAKSASRGQARMIVSSLQGALFVARSLGNRQIFEDTVGNMLDGLSRKPG
jgi:TetR/AcrR family transcriptional repressor of nem operon